MSVSFSRSLLRVLICSGLAAAVSAAAAAEDRLRQESDPDRPLGHQDFIPTPAHPVGWRGDWTGRFSGATPVTEWDEKSGKSILWKTDLPGFGYSMPIAVGDRVFVTTDPDLTICFDAATGKNIWQQSAALTQTPKHWHDQYGFSFPTPASDGRFVYVRFSTSVVCYDLTGNLVWKSPIPPGKDAFNAGSPALVGGRVVVHMGGGGKDKHHPPVIALDASTGRKVWEVPDVDHGYYGVVSPVPARIDGVDVVFTVSGYAIRVSDGKVLTTNIGVEPGWHKGRTHNVVVDDNTCYTLLWKGSAAQQIWRATALRLNLEKNDQLVSKPLWGPVGPDTAGWTKEKVGMPFTILHDGRFYVQSDYLYALDQKDGKMGKIAEVVGKARGWSYPEITAVGKYLFVGGSKGTVLVIEPGAEWKVVSENRIEGTIHNLGFAQGTRFYLRAKNALYCIGATK